MKGASSPSLDKHSPPLDVGLLHSIFWPPISRLLYTNTHTPAHTHPGICTSLPTLIHSPLIHPCIHTRIHFSAHSHPCTHLYTPTHTCTPTLPYIHSHFHTGPVHTHTFKFTLVNPIISNQVPQHKYAPFGSPLPSVVFIVWTTPWAFPGWKLRSPKKIFKQLHSSATLKLLWVLCALKSLVPPHTQVHLLAPTSSPPVPTTFLVTFTLK